MTGVVHRPLPAALPRRRDIGELVLVLLPSLSAPAALQQIISIRPMAAEDEAVWVCQTMPLLMC